MSHTCNRQEVNCVVGLCKCTGRLRTALQLVKSERGQIGEYNLSHHKKSRSLFSLAAYSVSLLLPAKHLASGSGVYSVGCRSNPD